jgi:hypothetical protein
MAFVSRAVAHGMGRSLLEHGFIDPDALAAPTSPLLRWYAGLLAEPARYAEVDDAGCVGPRPVRRSAPVHGRSAGLLGARRGDGRSRRRRWPGAAVPLRRSATAGGRPALDDARRSGGGAAPRASSRRRGSRGPRACSLPASVGVAHPAPGVAAGSLRGCPGGPRGVALTGGAGGRVRSSGGGRGRRHVPRPRVRATPRPSPGTCCCTEPTTWMRRSARGAVTGCAWVGVLHDPTAARRIVEHVPQHWGWELEVGRGAGLVGVAAERERVRRGLIAVGSPSPACSRECSRGWVVP